MGPTTPYHKKPTVTKPQQYMPRMINGPLSWQRNRNEHMDTNTGQRSDKNLKLATWNVRTLLQAGKMKEVANEMLKFQMDLMAIQEIRWQGQGKLDKKDFSIIYSGPDEKTGQLGTGFIISKTVRNSVIDYNTITDRICKIRLKGKFRNITIFSIHAPTEEKSDDIKESFYDKLDHALLQVPRYDMILVMGDFNAQVGCKENQRAVAGQYSLHDYNNGNGDYLADFASRNNLYIRSTSFQHKRIHMGTWKIPGKNEANQIDHVLISKRHYSSIIDVKACRGPNCDSDHYLIKTLVREKLATLQSLKRNKQTKWDTCKLKTDENVLSSYQEDIREKLEKNPGITVEEKWEYTKQVLIDVAKETVGEKRNERNDEWFDEECNNIIQQKNHARRVMLTRNTRRNSKRYKELRKQAKKIMKKKKKDSMTNMIKEIEDLNEAGEVRKFYAAVKRIKKDFQPRTAGCRNETGAIVISEREVMEKWANHFKILLNKEQQEHIVLETIHEIDAENNQNAEQDDIPTINEVGEAIKKMRNNRSPGEDDIVAELIKYGGDALRKTLHEIIKEIWKYERMPESWNMGIICPIHKKGDKADCGNYRGITLLNTAYKILTTVINNRIKDSITDKIGEYQCGFRPARGTTDQLFVLRQITEKCYEYDIDLNILFVDFKQAFDSVKRGKLKEAMEDLEIPSKLINLAMMTMLNSKAKVKIDNKISEAFEINTGVKQGDSLSGTLFIIALHKVIESIDQRGTIFNKSTQICAYADDVAIIARTKQRLVELYKEIEERGKEMGLIVNEAKTVYMKMSTSEVRRKPDDLKIEDKNFKGVSQFRYLGEIVNNTGSIGAAIKDRIQSGNRAYFANQSLLKNKLISRKTKMKIYRTLIRPIITYGCETWVLTKEDREKIRRCERKIIRRIYGPIRMSETEWRARYNVEIDEILNGENIVRFIKSQRLRWFGHIHRMGEDRMPKKITKAQVYNTRKRGRPRGRWVDDVTGDLATMRVRGWGTTVRDRIAWRRIVAEAKAHPEL